MVVVKSTHGVYLFTFMGPVCRVDEVGDVDVGETIILILGMP